MARLAMIVSLAIGLILILMLVYTAFKSVRHASQIIANRVTMMIESTAAIEAAQPFRAVACQCRIENNS